MTAMYTRREIAKLTLGTAALAALPAFGAGDVRLGATTWSLRDLPRIPGRDNVDDLIGPLKSAGVKEIDLWSYNTEPAGPNTGPGAPPPPAAYPIKIKTYSKEEIAAAMLQARNLTRDFRLSTPPSYYEDIRAKFVAAGINVTAYTVKYNDTFTDEEIDSTFRQAKALGAASITAPGSPEIAKRLSTFADKHNLGVTITDLTPAGRFKLNVDIGAITAENGSPVAWLQENYKSAGQLTIKDRRRNKGQNEQYGDGDTPVRDVIRFVRDKQLTIPVFAEYEYLGLGTPAEELARCMDYLRAALA